MNSQRRVFRDFYVHRRRATFVATLKCGIQRSVKLHCDIREIFRKDWHMRIEFLIYLVLTFIAAHMHWR